MNSYIDFILKKSNDIIEDDILIMNLNVRNCIFNLIYFFVKKAYLLYKLE